MDIAINIMWIPFIIVLAVIVGYLIGRYEKKILQKEEAEERGGQKEDALSGSNREVHAEQAETAFHNGSNQEEGFGGHAAVRRHREVGKRIPQGNSIVSPVSGTPRAFYEGGRRGMVILPEDGQLYAPVSGKIIKLYPMGNAFILRMEEGTEVLVRVGSGPDEVYSMCFRPRIVQNEIVNKGKLLLAFDKECLEEAGEDVSVSVSLNEGINGREISCTQKSRVKVGDELMKIY